MEWTDVLRSYQSFRQSGELGKAVHKAHEAFQRRENALDHPCLAATIDLLLYTDIVRNVTDTSIADCMVQIELALKNNADRMTSAQKTYLLGLCKEIRRYMDILFVAHQQRLRKQAGFLHSGQLESRVQCLFAQLLEQISIYKAHEHQAWTTIPATFRVMMPLRDSANDVFELRYLAPSSVLSVLGKRRREEQEDKQQNDDSDDPLNLDSLVESASRLALDAKKAMGLEKVSTFAAAFKSYHLLTKSVLQRQLGELLDKKSHDANIKLMMSESDQVQKLAKDYLDWQREQKISLFGVAAQEAKQWLGSIYPEIEGIANMRMNPASLEKTFMANLSAIIGELKQRPSDAQLREAFNAIDDSVFTTVCNIQSPLVSKVDALVNELGQLSHRVAKSDSPRWKTHVAYDTVQFTPSNAELFLNTHRPEFGKFLEPIRTYTSAKPSSAAVSVPQSVIETTEIVLSLPQHVDKRMATLNDWVVFLQQLVYVGTFFKVFLENPAWVSSGV